METDNPNAMRLAAGGYRGEPPVYVPDGSADTLPSIRTCVNPGPDGGYQAFFLVEGISNHLPIFVPIGTNNGFSPNPQARGQSELFGEGQGGAAVIFDGTPLTWTLGSQSAIATSASASCFADAGPELPPPTPFAGCGDGICGLGEDCHTCPSDCDCSSLTPLVDCVRPRAQGGFEAWFGYRVSFDVGLPIGPENLFAPGNAPRGQPERFLAGEHHHLFAVVSNGSSLSWSLAGNRDGDERRPSVRPMRHDMSRWRELRRKHLRNIVWRRPLCRR